MPPKSSDVTTPVTDPITPTPADETGTPAPETTGAAAAAVELAPETFPVKGRINMRTDGAPQASYNLVVLNDDAKANLAALASEFGFSAESQNGESFVKVVMDAKSKSILRRTGVHQLVIEGELTIVDSTTGRDAEGRLTVTSAKAATIRDGGRIKTPNPENAERRREFAMSRQTRR